MSAHGVPEGCHVRLVTVHGAGAMTGAVPERQPARTRVSELRRQPPQLRRARTVCELRVQAQDLPISDAEAVKGWGEPAVDPSPVRVVARRAARPLVVPRSGSGEPGQGTVGRPVVAAVLLGGPICIDVTDIEQAIEARSRD